MQYNDYWKLCNIWVLLGDLLLVWHTFVFQGWKTASIRLIGTVWEDVAFLGFIQVCLSFPQLLWTTVSSVWQPSQYKTVFSSSYGICVWICAQCLLFCYGCFWEVWFPHSFPSSKYMKIAEILPEPFLLKAKWSQLFQPLLIWKMLHISKANDSALSLKQV